MKNVIEQWLKENTSIVRAHDGTMRIALPYKFEFSTPAATDEKGSDYNQAISEVASQIAAHIENSRGGH